MGKIVRRSSLWKSDEEILKDLRSLQFHYAKWGMWRWIVRPFFLKSLRKWSVSNALLIPVTLPVKKLYWGYGCYAPEDTPSLVPRWSIAMLHVLALAYADQAIAEDKLFLNLLKDLDPRGHHFCRIADLFEILADTNRSLDEVLKGCERVYLYIRYVPFSDSNMRGLEWLITALVRLTQRNAVRAIEEAIEEIDGYFEMTQVTEIIRKAAIEMNDSQNGHSRYKFGINVQDLRENIKRLGIHKEVRQWIVC